MEMELVPGSHIPDGLLAAMTLLSEKPRQGVPSWNAAPIQGISEANCTAAIGLRFRGWEIVSGTVVAPSNGIAAKPGGCMVVNGKTVCPSPIDKYNFLHPGQTNYRDSNSRCSQHTTVNNKTGQVQSHIDEFNPNDYFLEHVMLDVIPDVIYDITGSYLFPTGNQFCPQ